MCVCVCVCVCVCLKILTLFFTGGLCPITVDFFHHPFLNLSLISRFPIYRGLPRFGVIDCPAANKSLFHFLFNTCNGYAVGWGITGGFAPCVKIARIWIFHYLKKKLKWIWVVW